MDDSSIGLTCRHPRVVAGARLRNVASVRCCQCGHVWREVHPSRTARISALLRGAPFPDRGRLARLSDW